MQTVMKAEAFEVAAVDDVAGNDRELGGEELDSVAGGNGLKLMGEILSRVAKTRSEISMTFARNARA